MRPQGWSRYQFVRYVIVKVLFLLYVACGLIKIGLAGCMGFLGEWGYMSSLFISGCILIAVAIPIGIWEYSLRPKVDDEPFY